MSGYDKPLPEPSHETQPFWDGLRRHQLVLQRCANCHTVRHYPRPVCDRCYAMDCDWIEATGHGRIHTWTVSHHAFHSGFKLCLPYVTITVDLDEGVRLQAPLLDAAGVVLALDLPVAIAYADVTSAVTLPRFRLRESARGADG